MYTVINFMLCRHNTTALLFYQANFMNFLQIVVIFRKFSRHRGAVYDFGIINQQVLTLIEGEFDGLIHDALIASL